MAGKTRVYFDAIFEGTYQDDWNSMYLTVGNLSIPDEVKYLLSNRDNERWTLHSRAALPDAVPARKHPPIFGPNPKPLIPLYEPCRSDGGITIMWLDSNVSTRVVSENDHLVPDDYSRGHWMRQRAVMLRDGRIFCYDPGGEDYARYAVPYLIKAGKQLFALEFQPSLADRVIDYFRELMEK